MTDARIELHDALKPLEKVFARDKAVTNFNAHSLCVNRKVFAMLVEGELVVKLPEARARELVAAKEGRLHALGKRVMREWFVSPSARRRGWVALAKEARRFVGASSPAAGVRLQTKTLARSRLRR